MTDVTTPPPSSPNSAREIWRLSPTAWKLAGVLGVVGFLFRIGGGSKTTVNGVVTSCSGFDAGPFIVGGVVAALVIGGYRGMRSKHPATRLAKQPAMIVGGALVALAAVRLLRGAVNPDGSFC